QGLYHPAMKARMDGLEVDRAGLAVKLEALPAPDPIPMHPGWADTYARKVADLANALNDDDTRTEAADLLRGLIDRIILRPDADAPKGHAIELFGELGAILSLCGNGMGGHAKARTKSAGVRQVTMVAGTGFEPVTFRL
ncbi:MAG: recombinase family protein, partial [Hyphomonas sp.]